MNKTPMPQPNESREETGKARRLESPIIFEGVDRTTAAKLELLIAERAGLGITLIQVCCPDCGETFEGHNAVNRVPDGLIAHSASGGACWKSLNSEFTAALHEYLATERH